MHELSIALAVVESVSERLLGEWRAGEGESGEPEVSARLPGPGQPGGSQPGAWRPGEAREPAARPRVESVTLVVGALSGVDPAALRFAFPEATAGTALDGAVLEIEEVGIVAFCPSCGREQAIPSVRRLRCPVCRTPTPRIVRGRELEILRVAIVEG